MLTWIRVGESLTGLELLHSGGIRSEDGQSHHLHDRLAHFFDWGACIERHIDARGFRLVLASGCPR